MTVSVKIANWYADGHESQTVATVRAPEPGEDLDDWWNDVVFEHTGDGHGIDGMGSCYTAEVVAAADPQLVGETNEWVD